MKLQNISKSWKKNNYLIFIFLAYLLIYFFFNIIYNYVSTFNFFLIFIDIYISLKHFIYGFIFAIIIGFPIGVLSGYFNQIYNILNPIIEIIKPIPPLAWVPFSIIFLKLTNNAASFIIFIGVIFPIIISIQSSIQKVPLIYIEAAKVLGCINHFYLIWYIILPSIKSSIYSGVKVASGVGWMCLVAAEMFGINGVGLGYKISYFYNLQRIDIVLLYMVLLGLLGLSLDIVFKKYIIN